LIRENASRDVAPLLRKLRLCHMFTIGAFVAGRPWAVQIKNYRSEDFFSRITLDRFETHGREITESGLGFIFGDPRAITRPDIDGLVTISGRKPRSPKDFSNLLVSLNRRIAATPAGRVTISPSCVTSYIPPGGLPIDSKFHDSSSAPSPRVVPMVVMGVDVTEIMRTMMSHTGPSSASFQQEQEQAMRRAAVPRNRLGPHR
jgi:hypothetical protein